MVWLWCARLTWALLPVSAGSALGDALEGWSTSPARVAAVLLWTAWTVGLVALLAPRPWGLTALRVVAPAAVVVAFLSIGGTSASAATFAVPSCVVAAVLALSAPVAQAAGNAIAYGDEVRFPLRTPLSLFLGPVPLAVALIGGGVSVGPLLLADGRYVAGVPVNACWCCGRRRARAVPARARRRWLVLVPAGVVVVDPLTLVDPVLMRREQIRACSRSPDQRSAHRSTCGSARSRARSCSRCEPQSFARRRGRHDAELHDAEIVLVSTVRADALVRTAGERRLAIA